MQLLSEPQKPTDIVKYYETNGGIVADGVFGVNSIVMNQYFNSKGIKTEYTPWHSEMDKKIAETGTAVLEYTNLPYMHYVTIHYMDDVYRIYNAGGSFGDEAVETESIDEWLKENDFYPFALITTRK